MGKTAERGFQLNMRVSRSSESAGGYVQRFRGESEYPDRGGGDSEGIQKYKEEENWVELRVGKKKVKCGYGD